MPEESPSNLTGKPFSASAFTKHLKQLFFHLGGTQISINCLRSSFVTYAYSKEECSDSLKDSIASALRHTVKQSQATYDRRTANQKKQGAMSLATELVRASTSRASIETRKEGKGDSCSLEVGDFVALLEEGSTLKYPKVFIGQIQSFFEDNQPLCGTVTTVGANTHSSLNLSLG
ncbi:hypothetical protein QZH41_018295 [Actinostola sp. cb2023]|nr:hypothetical protein QZH41_018295 [Actinostola sp. cb2023]